MRNIARSMLLLTLLTVGSALAGEINRYQWTFEPANVNAVANDFHLSTVSILVRPLSGTFKKNNWANARTRQVDFTQGKVASGQPTTITFTTKFANPDACGYFTINGVQAGKCVPPNTLKISDLMVNAAGHAELSLVDDLGTPVTGNVSVYVDNGSSRDFNQTDFETLDDAQLVFSAPALKLQNGEGFSDISFQLGADQYILIEGSLNAGNGLGPEAFGVGLTVPEPSMVLVVGAALVWIIARGSRKSKILRLPAR